MIVTVALACCFSYLFSSRDNVSAFSYIERQTNNSGLMAKPYMERQAKSRKRLCLGTKDKETKMHITQKLFVGFLPNLHQQTRRVFVHPFGSGLCMLQWNSDDYDIIYENVTLQKLLFVIFNSCLNTNPQKTRHQSPRQMSPDTITSHYFSNP